jgi:hypothetical protein
MRDIKKTGPDLDIAKPAPRLELIVHIIRYVDMTKDQEKISLLAETYKSDSFFLNF